MRGYIFGVDLSTIRCYCVKKIFIVQVSVLVPAFIRLLSENDTVDSSILFDHSNKFKQ